MTFAELQAFDVGRLKPGTRYAETHPEQEARDGERIPLLDDVVALAKRTNKRLWIELKTPLLGGKGGENAVTLADAVIDLLQTHDAVQLAAFVAFDWAGLVHAKRRAPGIETRFTTLPQRWFADPVPKEDEPPRPISSPLCAVWRPKAHRGRRASIEGSPGPSRRGEGGGRRRLVPVFSGRDARNGGGDQGARPLAGSLDRKRPRRNAPPDRPGRGRHLHRPAGPLPRPLTAASVWPQKRGS